MNSVENYGHFQKYYFAITLADEGRIGGRAIPVEWVVNCDVRFVLLRLVVLAVITFPEVGCNSVNQRLCGAFTFLEMALIRSLACLRLYAEIEV